MKSSSSATVNSLLKKEEEDLARAIQLSIKESTAQASKQQTTNTNSLYSSLSNLKNNKQQHQQEAENQKVKALYDFEAVEENEITFKAGDILFVTDNSDQNWWKGYDRNSKEGLFPSNFVTSDLAYEIETFETKSDKKVSFNNTVNIKELHTEIEENQRNHEPLIINEKKIDECIELLQNADPTGEIQPDSQEMLNLEDECYMMGPLIDQQLQKIDYKHATLEDLNLKILEAFQMYNNLMKDSLNKSNSFIGSSSTTSNINNNNPGSMYSNVNMLPATNNFMPPSSMLSSQTTNSIPFVAAPPAEAAVSAHLLANQLNSFAAVTNNNNNTFANSGLPPSYNQSYSHYSTYSLPNEHMNVNQQQQQQQHMAAANNFISMPMSNQNGINPLPENNYQLNVQYGQPS